MTNLHSKKTIMLLGSTALITASLLANNAVAQSPTRLDEIIVTAQKRAQNANEVPMSIIAYTGETLNKKGIVDTADIAAIVPGMTYADSIGGTPIYSMRGVGFNEMSAQAASTIGVYTDEIGVPVPIMTAGMLIDIERVEILKGPQGTLYGRNSTGGAINYIANKPDGEFEAGVNLGYGSYGVKTLSGFVNGGSDTLSARLAVKGVRSNKGWQKSSSRDLTLGRQDKAAARLSILASLSENTTALLRADYWEDKSETLAPQFLEFNPGNAGNAGVVAILAGNMPTSPTADDATIAEWQDGFQPAKNQKNKSISLTVKHGLTENIELTSLTNYAEYREDGSIYDRAGILGIDASSVPAGYKSGTIAGVNTGFITNDVLEVDSTVDTFSQELRVSGEFDLVSWTAGLFYADNSITSDVLQIQNVTTSTNLAPIPPANISTFGNEIEQNAITKAVFASADWHVSDDLTITTGIRYTDDSKDFAGCTKDSGDGSAATLFAVVLGVAPPTDGSTCITVIEDAVWQSGIVRKELSEDSLSYRLAVDYDLDENISTYASYTRGFKAGSFPTAGAFKHITFDPVVQERIDAIEIGFKATLADGRAQLNGAIYHYDYQNKQLITKKPDAVFGLLFALDNVPKSKVKGAEIDFKLAATEELTLGLAANYNDTEITQYTGFTQLGANLDFAGSPFPFAAKFQLAATADYEWEISNALLGRISVSSSYTDSANTDYVGSGAAIDPRFTTPSYTLTDLNIGISDIDDNWSVSVWAKNITDEFYSTNTVQQSDVIARYVGMPRTVGITLGYNFF